MPLQVVVVVFEACASQSHQRFYLQPDTSPIDGEYRFINKPFPSSRLKTFVSTIMMFSKADVKGAFTNHSLRATGVSTLFTKGVLEALFQKRSGHHSVDSLRLYEKKNLRILNILAGKSKSFQKEMEFDDNGSDTKKFSRKWWRTLIQTIAVRRTHSTQPLTHHCLICHL